MSDHEHGEAIEWLLENWIARLADSLEGMTGERPAGVWRALEGVPSGAGDVLWWEQPLSLGESATFWAGAPQAAWVEIGSQVLRGAGIEVSDPHDARNTYLEVLSQACSGLARVIGSRVGAEVACGKGHENPPPATGVAVFDIDMTLGGAPLAALHLCLPPAVRNVFQTGVARPGPSAIAAHSGGALEPRAESSDAPRTLDLLLEVIVTGCVIARGEVVVVEGNYGVRIQEIISREKRLRTLP
jgi:flagellar motor switch protein FliN/FliY